MTKIESSNVDLLENILRPCQRLKRTYNFMSYKKYLNTSHQVS